jgi:hypothetical protein
MNKNTLAWFGCMVMSSMTLLSSSVLAQEAAPVMSSAPAEEPKIAASPVEASVETGSWMIGTRWTRFELLDDTRGTPNNGSFMGTITMLKDDQDDTPNKLFAQYRLFESWCWIGLSYDHVRAAAWDEGGTDGSVDLEGFIPYVQARWENTTLVVPYVEAGLALYNVDFEESSGWSADGQRSVKLDDSVTGMEIAGGAAVRVYKNLSIDFYAQYMNVEDITGKWYDFGEPFGDVIFTMSHVTYGIGAQVQF